MNYQTRYHSGAINCDRSRKRIFLLFLLIFLSSSVSFSQEIPKRPVPPRLVNDLAGILTGEQVGNLERKLVNFNDTTSNQIAVVIVNSLDGYAPSEFAYEIGEKWGVGQAKFDNGVVVLVKPKTFSERGEAFIATGYGVEGVIPDITAKRIVEHEMIPFFRENNYYEGLDKATSVIMSLIAEEFSSKDYNKKTGGAPLGAFLPFILIFLIFWLIFRNKRSYYSTGKRSSSLPFWTALWLGSMMGSGGSRSGGGWGNFSSGGGNFGGGFGGFGGGGFGGGGAGGSW